MFHLSLEHVLIFANEVMYDRDHFTKLVPHLFCSSQFRFTAASITLYHFIAAFRPNQQHFAVTKHQESI